MQLPSTFNDSTNQIAQTCSPQQLGNSFIVTGRGGISPDPTEALSQTPVWMDREAVNGERSRRVEERKDANSTFNAPLVEATRLSRNADGSISLVAEAEAQTSEATDYAERSAIPVGSPVESVANVSRIAALNCQTHFLGR